MNDIVIKGQRLKQELTILLWAYLAANLLNLFSIIIYKTSWVELLTFQLMVLAITYCFYLLTWIARGIWFTWRIIMKKSD